VTTKPVRACVCVCVCVFARDTQGLDTVLEGHGVLPPASPGHGKDAVERRRSRELLEQQEAAQLMFEKKREADMAMLEKLRGAGATADTLRYVETAIKRRAEAGIYVDSCCASSELHPLTAEAPRPCAAPHTAEAALSARSNVSATDAARARDAWDQNGRHLRDALDRGDESHRGDTSYRGDSYRGDFREDVSFGDDRTHSQAINMNYAKAGLGDCIHTLAVVPGTQAPREELSPTSFCSVPDVKI